MIMTDFEKFITEGGDDLSDVPVKATKTKTYPCGQCGGTGRWSGGVNMRGETKCFACRGTGSFKTDPRKLAQNREKARLRKADKAKAVAEAFNAENSELVEFLIGAAAWSEFASSLLVAGRKYGSLTARQALAADNMRAKCEATAADKKKAKDAEPPAPTVDLSPIRAMFETALKNGHKRPKYRAEGLVINRAPDHGNNPGALYVKTTGDEYQGKVLGVEFFKVRDTLPETMTALATIAAHPLEAAAKYGRLTGECSCCGRELTDPNSIEAGIGPVCATKWFGE